MATQLNPGADPTLVQAAYAASMANVPQDYSKAFGQMAEGYAKGLEGIQAAILPVAKALGNSEKFQKLLKEVGSGILEEIGGVVESVKQGFEDSDDFPLEEFTEGQQSLVDSNLWYQIDQDNDYDYYARADQSKEDIEDLQRDLQSSGYNIDYENKDGVWIRGEAAVDGNLGGPNSSTRQALKQARLDAKDIQSTAMWAQMQIDYYSEMRDSDRNYWSDEVELEISSGAPPTNFAIWDSDNNEFTLDLTTKEGQDQARKIAAANDEYAHAGRLKDIEDWETELAKRTKVLNLGSTYTRTNENGTIEEFKIVSFEDAIMQIKSDMVEANQIENKEDRDERMQELNNQMSIMKKDKRNADKTEAITQGLIKNNLLNPTAMNGMAIDYLRAWNQSGRPISGEGIVDGSRVVRGFNEENKQVYIWVDKHGRAIVDPVTGQDFAANTSEIDKYIVKTDAELETDISTLNMEGPLDDGKNGIPLNETEVVNDTIKRITKGGENGFLDAINVVQMDMENTYANMVWGVGFDENGEMITKPNWLSDNLYKQLIKLGDRFDFNKDGAERGVINANDFLTKENYSALANYLTKYNPTSVATFANVLKESAKRYHAQGDKSRPKDKEDQETGFKTTGNYFIAKQHVPVASVNPTITALDSGTDYKMVGIPFNNDWKAHRKIDGQYQMYPGDGETSEDWVDVPDANTIALNLGIQHLLGTSTATATIDDGGLDIPSDDPFMMKQGDMSDEAYKGRKISKINEMFKTGNKQLQSSDFTDKNVIQTGSGTQAIKPMDLLSAFAKIGVSIQNPADLKSVLDKVETNTEYRDKILKELNGTKYGGNNTKNINIWPEKLHAFIQRLYNRIDPAYGHALTQQTGTTSYADLNE